MEGYIGPAISIRNLNLTYGFAKSKVEILRGVNMCVETGIIYGLLGPSGCGKTSLVRTIVGSSNPNKGIIELYGQTPGSAKCKIPGSAVGYMPQELALYQDLTIGEVINYFGRLHQMTRWKLEKRFHSLTALLDLPAGNRIIQQLSGGQKRRVSLAIALLHKPQLIILDEPTVGIDPIIRESIWNHLIKLCRKGRVTILMTTHYIDEAHQANKIGFMRNGRILTEESPEVLLSVYNSTTLEGVFLELCKEDATKIHVPNSVVARSKMKPRRTNFFVQQNFGRISALVFKNFTQMRRNLILLLFQFLLPAFQITSFFLSMGGEPHNLKVAVFNKDTNFGVKYLQHINNGAVSQLPVASYKDGLDLVVKGEAHSLLYINSNFSDALFARFTTAERNLSPDLIEASRIHIRLDTTSQQITFILMKLFVDALNTLAIELLPKNNPEILTRLLEFGEPIYGNTSDKSYMTDFMAPGIILAAIFIAALALTLVSFIYDKKERLFARNTVAGVTSFELMSGYILTQLVVVVLQVGIVLFIAIEVFEMQNKGSLLLVISFAVLQGMCGMTLGFLVSTICNDESSAFFLAVTVYLPIFAMSGILWPTLGMSKFNQNVSEVLPHTQAAISMRWIMLYGKNILWGSVWPGFFSTIAWIFIFTILSAIIIRVKQA